MYELIIIGGGPAGVGAAVYAARKRLNTLFITEEFGGQSVVSPHIQNWIGTVEVPGHAFADQLEEHARAYADDVMDIKTGIRVSRIEQDENGFTAITNEDTARTYRSRAVLITTGSHRRKLDIPGAEKFDNKGISYCASCDGPIFTGQDVVVVGGGNAGFEAAAQLLAYTNSVTLLHRHVQFKADDITVNKVLEHENMTALPNTEPTEIKGDAMVSSVVYRDIETGETKEMEAQGVFVEIGAIPTTDLAADLLELDEYKRIEIDPWHQTTSVEGVWAAGDCTNRLYHQNNIAAGDAVRALEDIYMWLKAR